MEEDAKNESLEIQALKMTLDRYLPGFTRRYAENYAELVRQEERRAEAAREEHRKKQVEGVEPREPSTLEVEEHALGAGE